MYWMRKQVTLITFGQAKLSYSLGIISSSETVQYMRNFKFVVPDKVLELH